MTCNVDQSGAEIRCDECGSVLFDTDMKALIIQCARSRWVVFNDPSNGVHHYCGACSHLHELAIRLSPSMSFQMADRGSGDVTGLLENIVMTAAKHRAKTVPTVSFGMRFDDED